MTELDHPALKLKVLLVFLVLEKIPERIHSQPNLFNKFSKHILPLRPRK